MLIITNWTLNMPRRSCVTCGMSSFTRRKAGAARKKYPIVKSRMTVAASAAAFAVMRARFLFLVPGSAASAVAYDSTCELPHYWALVGGLSGALHDRDARVTGKRVCRRAAWLSLARTRPGAAARDW